MCFLEWWRWRRGHLDRLWGEELFPVFRCSRSERLTRLSGKLNQSASLQDNIPEYIGRLRFQTECLGIQKHANSHSAVWRRKNLLAREFSTFRVQLRQQNLQNSRGNFVLCSRGLKTPVGCPFPSCLPSAGVGRTGCFIVIDAMTERIKQEKTVDVYGHVTLMRSQRNYMVQTEDQYIFIHDALLEAVTCGNTEVPARNLYSYIQRLTQMEPGENVTGMELEFKVG